MKHSEFVDRRHATTKNRSLRPEVLPLTDRDPGTAFLRQEIELNRKSERWLILNGFISLVFVAILVTVRLVFFT
jgi:hypothetical protein